MPARPLIKVEQRRGSTAKTAWWKPMLMGSVLLLAVLACADTEISYIVEPGGESPDKVTEIYGQHLTQAYLDAAQAAEDQRRVDYTSANLPYAPFLPTTVSGLDLFESQRSELESQGFSVVMDSTGYIATKDYILSGETGDEEWTVTLEQNANNPQLMTYTFRRSFDFMDVDLADIDEMFHSDLPDKPPPSSGGSSSGGSGGFLDIFSVLGDMVDTASDLDMWYVQKVLKDSGMPLYTIHVTLPGKVITHTMDGVTVGELTDGTVTLTIDEAYVRSHAGQQYEFEVQSLFLDCSNTCTGTPHLFLDETSDGTSCSCVCEKGWTLVEETDVCTNCETFCVVKNPEFVYDPSKSETNSCACACKEPLVMNASGTACVEPLKEEPGSIPGDRLEGIIQVVLLGEEGHLWDIPGWDNLTRDEQRNLEALVETIKITLGLSQQPPLEDQSPYPEGHPCHGLPGPEACSLYLAKQNELARDKWLLEQLANIVQDEIDRRKRIQGVIADEIQGDAKYAAYIKDVATWWGRRNMTSLEIAKDILQSKLTDQAKEELLGKEPRDLEQASEGLLEWIPEASTHFVVDDYYFYREIYDQQISQGTSDTVARSRALESVRNRIDNSMYGFGRAEWFENGVYASAFEKLDRSMGSGGGQ